MKTRNIIKIGIFTIAISIAISSCGGGDDPINNVTPTPTPAKTVKVESVSLDVSSLNLEEGDEKTINVTISPSNAENKKYTFTSSDSDVVTVDESGKVKALKSGEATITVTTSDGNKTATCKVTVTSKVIPVEALSFESTEFIIEEGSELTISYTLTPDDATDKSIIWTSSDTTVVAVDENGKLTAVKAGEATVTATSADGNKTTSCEVTVTPKVTQIELWKTELTLLEGREEQIRYSIIPEDVSNAIIIWSSADPTIVAVDENGKLTALKAGEATITAATPAGNITATCKVIVDKIIEFADERAKEMCLKYFDKNRDGELSMSEAASVQSISSNFFDTYRKEVRTFRKFNEFQYFTSLEGLSCELFSGQHLTEITLPPNITYISDGAFENCQMLTSINIPEGVTSIGRGAFGSCHSLTNVTLPSTLTSIGGYAFVDCWCLTSINIPNCLSKIEGSTFENCQRLTSITIPNGVKSIGYNAFSKCFSLTSINIPEGVTIIDSHAFYDCRSLTNVTLPSTITRINGAFGKSLWAKGEFFITLLSEYPPYLGDVHGLGEFCSFTTIFVPSQAVDRYKDAWKEYASIIKPIP